MHSKQIKGFQFSWGQAHNFGYAQLNSAAVAGQIKT